MTFLIVSLILCSACGTSGGNSTDAEKNTMDVTVNAKGQEVNEDFSKNVNVNRASEYAKNELALPVKDIGRKISTDVKANEKYRIVVMTRNSTNPYMIGMWSGGQQAGKDMGCTVETLAPSNQDSIEDQITIMESMIESGVDGFVIHPSDSKGIQPVVDLANEKGIPVAAIGT
ncbi:MAG: substrate-binding domain-containing protein, partial [Eubacterium sp.]|nr:substrate-binding domain-containing protein [Eubacterium sp.]